MELFNVKWVAGEQRSTSGRPMAKLEVTVCVNSEHVVAAAVRGAMDMMALKENNIYEISITGP